MSRFETKATWRNLLTECDLLLKSGRIPEAQQLLRPLNAAKPPREFREPLAKTCRRAGLIELGLRLLQEIVRTDSRTTRLSASAGELCEYAVLLSRNGSLNEAIQILSEINCAKTPEAHLYLGFCHVMLWNYAEATEKFRNYLRSSEENYNSLIANVNLAGALVTAEQYAEARDATERALRLAEAAKADRLRANCLELLSQILIHEKKFDAAKECLEQAQRIFGATRSLDQLLVIKSAAWLSALEDDNLEPLQEFRREAKARGHWDGMREADLLLLRCQFEQRTFNHLFIGSPLKGYRERIRRFLPYSASSEYVRGDARAVVLELTQPAHEITIKLHQLLLCLASDFYAPKSLGTLFAEIYRDEYFDIDSSPGRVHQLVFRLREWLTDHGLPLKITSQNGHFQLELSGPIALKVPREIDPSALADENLVRLASAFQVGELFTINDACSQLALSKSSFQRLARAASEKGWLRRHGQGKATHYELLKAS